jgi:hypothetical protein
MIFGNGWGAVSNEEDLVRSGWGSPDDFLSSHW